MIDAVAAVREKKMACRTAAKLFGVPRTTLRRFVKDDCLAEDIVKRKMGRKPVLPLDIEKDLVKYLLLMENKFYGFTPRDVKNMAYQLAIKNNISHPFSNEGAGRAWFDHFFNRHKDVLRVRKSKGTSNAPFDQECVKKFFDLLEEEYERHSYPPDRIFSVDVTGLTIVQTKIPRIISLRGKRQIAAITPAQRGVLITVVCSMSASGIFIPPMIIYPRKSMAQTLVRGAPPGSLGRCHPSAYIQAELFTEWFQHFITRTKPTQESPVLLVWDGNNTHTRNINVMDLARENNVVILCLPPHMTQAFQPLDKTFMGSLKMFYSEHVTRWLLDSQRPIRSYDITELFGKAYLQCQTASIAVDGFKESGIYPLDRNVVEYNNFTTAELEDVDAVLSKPTPGCGERRKSSDSETSEESGPQSSASDASDIETTEADAYAVCIFCGERYSAERSAKIWIRCLICHSWAHRECTSCETDEYLCDFCL